MRVTVDFEECLKDSPRFRAALEDVEGDVTELELKLDKLVKLCIAMIDTGKAFCGANKQFIHGLRDLAHYSSKDELVEGSLTKFSDSLQEMINYHMILFDQTQRSIKAQLQMFVKEDIRKFKDGKKQFEKVSEEKENALAKNAQAPRNKQHEVEEATNILTATRKCFRHIALDYVLQINVLQSKRRSEILKSMLSFMCAHLAFFHQGYDLFSELGPYMKELGAQLDHLALDAAREKKEMEQKHSTIQQKDFSSDEMKLEYNVDAVNGIVMEGYLFKRASNAFKTWNRKPPSGIRRWFSIQNNQLVYQKKFRDAPTVVVEDLRLCTVKPCEDLERRFCFEVVSPTKSCILQADSEKLRQAWIQAVQTSIASAYREKGEEAEVERKRPPSTGSPESSQESKEKSLKGEGSLQRVQAIAGNVACCDCGMADPRWASINLGITLCIECSGIHRSLGVHFSKVRSLTLDSWEPELLKLMCELGNSVINRVYEANREKMGAKKPHPGSQRYLAPLCRSCILQADSEKLRQAWIQAVQTSIASAYREKGEEAEVERKRPPSTGSPESSQESKEKSLKGEGSLQRGGPPLGQHQPWHHAVHRVLGHSQEPGCPFLQGPSLTLDLWEPELLKLMCELGNSVINRVYEANREKMGAKKPHPGSQRQEKEEYIRAKYVERRFVSPADPGGKPTLTPNQEVKKRGSPENTVASLKASSSDQGPQPGREDSRELLVAVAPARVLHEPGGESQEREAASAAASQDARLWIAGLQLYQAAYQKSLPHMAEALAQGADVNWSNQEKNGFTPLIQAVRGGSLVTCEFLLQNGANVNLRDTQGRGPLHHATILGHTGQVCLFLKRGANQHARDQDGKDPLSVAIEAANADIVTLLRLARMNEEMRESEGLYGQPGDETYQDIFRDFSQMASNNPEKLKRFQPPDTPEP
ncbi:arf-GAP with coiled-coil, ANK repeat and PH domain-containing protein 2 [Ahaetulla prasina]|uniref:arf-GAP with coiled-coil, ANK repeat and PH domain-containing protein 2 n=1 Tax=Ahaetulla prasina TaxID=499056 RepID=UPI0026475FF3|nr:arf-GAP with coiled-coil, ANK repeat and PH domain-containing protein 2 [Ahaetulla prasina]